MSSLDGLLQLLDPRATAVEAMHAATAIYTADPVVDRMLDRVNWAEWAESGGRLLDPSAGDGAFVMQALSMIDTPPGDLAAVSRVMGIEIYPGAVRDARKRVAALLASRDWSSAAAEAAAMRVIREGDFLADGAPEDAGIFSVIAGNPPYLRMANVPDVFKQLYASILPGYAQADLLHAFLDRCDDVIAPGGAIVLVTSDRWLGNENAARLREKIGLKHGLVHVERLDCDSAFYQAKIRRKGSLPRIHPVVVEFRPAELATIRLDGRPISPDDSSTLRGDCGPTLADIAEVNIAPWLGPEGVFVVSEAVARQLTDANLVPAVDTDDIDREHDVLLPPRRFAIVTDRQQEPNGLVREHIQLGLPKMPKRAQRASSWWLPPERVIPERIAHDRLLIPRIARRLRCINIPAGVAALNHNLTVASPSHGIPLETLREVLLSDASQAWIARNAPRLENGFYSITTRLLRRLPVPAHLVPKV